MNGLVFFFYLLADLPFNCISYVFHISAAFVIEREQYENDLYQLKLWDLGIVETHHIKSLIDGMHIL